MSTIVSASLLSSNLCHLEREIRSALTAGCEYIHFDVMDGHFADNLTYGIPVLEACKKAIPEALFDVHLMIDKPQDFALRFLDAGADILTFHVEADCEPRSVCQIIRDYGKKAGITVSPATPVEKLYEYLDCADMFLIMTVVPGFGGQAFMPHCAEKVSLLKDEMNKHRLNIPIEVDGGINAETARICVTAGADILVTGSYFFSKPESERRRAVEMIMR
ncbi:MAG: ribulose-phosphate 3-epimerase [Ruminococcus sp.]|nr:ribulose-phosphate 3-epimerase [Ruminococcus sp.]